MAGQPSERRGRGFAALALLALASLTGLLFAGTGLEAAPPLEARTHAEQAAALRMASTAADWRRTPSPAGRFPLLEGLELVRLPSHATRLRVPSVGIDAEVRAVGLVFRNGLLQYDTPMVEAGQYAGSVAPGKAGNTVIGGHVATRGGVAVFRDLPAVNIGAVVEVDRGEETFRYQVTHIQVVAADATSVMEQTQDATLTLITCSSDPNRSHRVVVVGKLL